MRQGHAVPEEGCGTGKVGRQEEPDHEAERALHLHHGQGGGDADQ